MTQRVEIDCINKDERYNPYEAIVRVGGPNGDGTRWNLPMRDAAEGSKEGKWSFFVHQGSHVVEVVHAISRYDNLYLRTEADYDTPDNLLSLPECG
jgi:hypothetical protein